MTKRECEDGDGGYLFASAASIAFASAIFSGETPSFSKTLMALDSPFASPALKKCSPKVSYPLFAMISGLMGGGVVRNAVLKFVDVVNLLSGLGLNRENFRFRKAGELCDFVNGLVFG